MREGVDEFSSRGKSESESWKKFAAHLHFDEADLSAAKAYKELAKSLTAQDKTWDDRAEPDLLSGPSARV